MRRFERPSDNADDRITHVCIRVTLTTSLGSDTFFGLRVGPVDRQRGTAGLEQARFDHSVARVDVAGGERVGGGGGTRGNPAGGLQRRRDISDAGSLSWKDVR